MTQKKYFNEILKIEEHLKENGIPAETFVYPNDFNKVDVNIEYGDWKHEHKFCDELMKEMGWKLESECYNEDFDSDCYSSTHIYTRIK